MSSFFDILFDRNLELNIFKIVRIKIYYDIFGFDFFIEILIIYAVINVD